MGLFESSFLAPHSWICSVCLARLAAIRRVKMIPPLKYAWLTIKHKYFVFLAGRKTKAHLWDLLTHDLSKLTPAELPHYGRQFFGDKGDPYGFIMCWLHHQNRNRHHWEYFIPRTGHNRCTSPYPANVPVPMPERYVREMVADWMGASRAYGGKWPVKGEWHWFNDNCAEIKKNVDPQTWMLVLQVLQEVDLFP